MKIDEILVLPGVHCVCVLKEGKIKKKVGDLPDKAKLQAVKGLAKAEVEQAIVDWGKERMLVLKIDDQEYVICVVEKRLLPEKILMEMERYGISRNRHKPR